MSGRVALTTVVIASGLFVPAAAWAAVGASGYVWASQPNTAQYISATGYEYNSAGGAIEIVRSAVGDYKVRFALLAMAGGVAQASAYGSGNSDFCTISGWGPSGTDELVGVRCFDGTGAPADSRFVANVTNRHAAGSFAFAWANVAAPAVWYSPPAGYGYDSGGMSIQIGRTSVGHYLVQTGAVKADLPAAYKNGFFNATAYGTDPVRCEVQIPNVGLPGFTPVICFDIDGDAVDSRFTFTYSRTVNLLGEAPAYASAMIMPSPIAPPGIAGFTNAGGAPVATEIGEGSYRVTFPGLASPRGHAMAKVFGTPPEYCTIAAWWPSGISEVVAVNCYDAGSHGPAGVYAVMVTFTA